MGVEELIKALRLMGFPEAAARAVADIATADGGYRPDKPPTFKDAKVDPSNVDDRRPSVPRSTSSPTPKPTPTKSPAKKKMGKKVDTSSQAPPAGFDPILVRRQLGRQNDNIGLLNTLNRLYLNDLLPISRFTENRSMND